ncbi:hypothetical protein ACFZBU_43360 [Embleya sp. NPDC008237]|uniref:hypothetical protein n=1 Tax=Embleya sp. NPDC008237 TaxID=3363978 RepID=UPI0036ED7F55
MRFLVVAVILVGLLCALDLLLTLGVVKRLRRHAELLDARVRDADDVRLPIAEIGSVVADFTTVSVDGRELTTRDVADDTLVAFLSPNCAPCREKLPDLVAYAAALPGEPDRVLAVVTGERAQCAAFVGELSPVARVVVEPPGGPVGRAFATSAYPATLRVRRVADGRLAVVDNDVELAAPGVGR